MAGKAWMLLLASAALQVLAFPSPNLYWLGWVALVPWLICLLNREETGRRAVLRAAGQGWLVGALWYLGTCYWIYISMRLHGGLSVLSSGFVLALFCAYLGIYHALFAAAVTGLRGRLPVAGMAAVIPLLWVGLELARSRVTAFPWDLMGYTQADNLTLLKVAPWTGVYGLSLLVVLVNALLAVGLAARRSGWVVAGALLGLALQAGALVKEASSEARATVVLLQQNLPLEAPGDWTRSYFDATIAELVQASEPRGFREVHAAKLIVWPESPAPFFLGDANFDRWMEALAQDAHSFVIAGAVGVPHPTSGEQQEEIFNSAALFSPEGHLQRRYDKIHLVPFGEYVPLVEYLTFAKELTKQVGAFTAGNKRVLLEAGEIRAGTFICYESVFPDEVRQFAKQGANVLVNISNDGWFGHSGAALQHLRMVRLRAAENQRWVLRATNSGITSVIDPLGRVVETGPMNVRYTLVAHFGLMPEQQTFYTVHGDRFAFVCSGLALAAFTLRRRW